MTTTKRTERGCVRTNRSNSRSATGSRSTTVGTSLCRLRGTDDPSVIDANFPETRRRDVGAVRTDAAHLRRLDPLARGDDVREEFTAGNPKRAVRVGSRE